MAAKDLPKTSLSKGDDQPILLESGPALAAIASDDIPESGPPSIPLEAQYREGAVRQVSRNEYERDPGARRRCIEYYGYRCSACGFDFEEVYGVIGSGFIHVHHLKPLSEIREEYVVDPIADLRPVCPNCHAMIHSGPEILTIESLSALIQSRAFASIQARLSEKRA